VRSDSALDGNKDHYVQYGSGLHAPISWRNFDCSPTLLLQSFPIIGRLFVTKVHPLFPENVEYGDIVKGLPIRLQTCKSIYCSHVLEHLALEDLRTALVNTYSYLSIGGLFRFVIPDLETLARIYLQSDDPNASIVFMEQSFLGKKSRARGLGEFLREWLGHSAHLWMWDFKAIASELEQVGFVDIRRAEFGDSLDPHFRDVEQRGQWNNCLGVECAK
jgi:hypothetical protein